MRSSIRVLAPVPWPIQKYMFGFSEGYSSASGFGGELYIDFGFYPALLILFVFGILLYELDMWIKYKSIYHLHTQIIGSVLFAWIFFATRSILTSTYVLIFTILASFLISKILLYLGIIEKVNVIHKRRLSPKRRSISFLASKVKFQ